MFEFIKANVFEIGVAVFVLWLLIARLFSKRSVQIKINNQLNVQISSSEYEEYKKIGKAVLINSPLSFETTEQMENSELNNNYCQSITNGCRLLLQEGFSFPDPEA